MAVNRFTNALADNDGSNPANWTLLALAPTDNLEFTIAGLGVSQNATFSAAMVCATLDIVAGYNAVLDFGDQDVTIAGNMTCDGGGTVRFGDGLTTIGGDLDFEHQTGVVDDQGTILMTGTAVTLQYNNADRLYNLTITGTCTVAAGAAFEILHIDHLLLVSGAAALLTLTPGEIRIQNDLQIDHASARITGTGTLYIGHDNGISDKTGILDVAILEIIGRHLAGAASEIPAGQYDSADVWIGSGASWQWVPTSGTYIFTGNVQVEQTNAIRTYTVDNSNNPNWVFQGDLDLTGAGAVNWQPGVGTMTFSGAAVAQSVDLDGETVESIIVDKIAGTVTFTADCGAGSFYCASGTIAVDRTLAIGGNFSLVPRAAGGVVLSISPLGTTAITVAGDCRFVGHSGSLLAMVGAVGWTLSVAGSTHAYFVDVAWSDASGGTVFIPISSTDSGNNTNWSFPAAAALDLSTDYTVFDGLENVLLNGVAVVDAYRLPYQVQEGDASAGAYLHTDVEWHLPTVGGISPAVGDTIQAAGRTFNILAVRHPFLNDYWGLITREPAITSDTTLRDLITLWPALTEIDSYGSSITSHPAADPLFTNVPAKVQIQPATVVVTGGRQVFERLFDVYVDRDIDPNEGDLLRDQDMIWYEIVSWDQRDKISTLSHFVVKYKD